MMRFIWIDDDPKRKRVSDLLGRELNVKIDFKNVEKEEIDKLVSDLIKSGNEPDLVILDHSLTHTVTETFKTGSTLSLYIREQWKNCPIISVSNVEIEKLDSRLRAAYDIMIPGNRISGYYSLIKSIATGFNSIKSKKLEKTEDLIKLFNPPDDDVSRIIQILPHELKDDFENPSYPSYIFKWALDIFFERPGFLYDEIWAATFLGLNEKGFASIKNKFDSAKYNGIFMNEIRPLWWKSRLLKVLAKNSNKVGLPWEIGRELVNNNPKYFSKCFVSNQEFPETVAALDETKHSDWKPMKLKETEPHTLFENMLFFEELRIMKPAQ